MIYSLLLSRNLRKTELNFRVLKLFRCFFLENLKGGGGGCVRFRNGGGCGR